ncbi:YdcF family protein [Corynebacterium nasicanis]|uniref:YdcF family protein n=2 Tax=Corynebacterium nasicanis TaxID=1448267 RepID=A0ABW1QAS0_9CORY
MRVISLVTLVLLVVLALVPVWLIFPPRPEVTHSDAVFVIAGSWDGRHELGAQLVEEGMADNYVVSNPEGSKDIYGYAHCAGEDRPAAPGGVWCMDPTPETTTGEGQTFATLAQEQGWSSVIAVTSRTHARRVQLVLDRCTDLRATVLPVETLDKDILGILIAREIGGHLKFWFTRPC